MFKTAIGRPINGISINGLEYLLDDNNELMMFDLPDQAETFLKKHNIDLEDVVLVDAETKSTVDNGCVMEQVGEYFIHYFMGSELPYWISDGEGDELDSFKTYKEAYQYADMQNKFMNHTINFIQGDTHE